MDCSKAGALLGKAVPVISSYTVCEIYPNDSKKQSSSPPTPPNSTSARVSASAIARAYTPEPAEISHRRKSTKPSLEHPPPMRVAASMRGIVSAQATESWKSRSKDATSSEGKASSDARRSSLRRAKDAPAPASIIRQKSDSVTLDALPDSEPLAAPLALGSRSAPGHRHPSSQACHPTRREWLAGTTPAFEVRPGRDPGARPGPHAHVVGPPPPPPSFGSGFSAARPWMRRYCGDEGPSASRTTRLNRRKRS